MTHKISSNNINNYFIITNSIIPIPNLRKKRYTQKQKYSSLLFYSASKSKLAGDYKSNKFHIW